jgi:hypothetical protein
MNVTQPVLDLAERPDRQLQKALVAAEQSGYGLPAFPIAHPCLGYG